MRLDDTSAIVTGAASGLGSATAPALAAAGVRVFGLDLAADSGLHIDGVRYISTDVTSGEPSTASG